MESKVRRTTGVAAMTQQKAASVQSRTCLQGSMDDLHVPQKVAGVPITSDEEICVLQQCHTRDGTERQILLDMHGTKCCLLRPFWSKPCRHLRQAALEGGAVDRCLAAALADTGVCTCCLAAGSARDVRNGFERLNERNRGDAGAKRGSTSMRPTRRRDWGRGAGAWGLG
jgi:hypothetical protein